jgi:hypothetical protein
MRSYPGATPDFDFGEPPSGLTSARSVEPSLWVEDSRAGLPILDWGFQSKIQNRKSKIAPADANSYLKTDQTPTCAFTRGSATRSSARSRCWGSQPGSWNAWPTRPPRARRVSCYLALEGQSFGQRSGKLSARPTNAAALCIRGLHKHSSRTPNFARRTSNAAPRTPRSSRRRTPDARLVSPHSTRIEAGER